MILNPNVFPLVDASATCNTKRSKVSTCLSNLNPLFPLFRAILSQMQGGVEKFISAYSRKLGKFEQNYAPVKGELLAIILSLRKFEHLLRGQPFVIKTDNSAIEFIMKNSHSRGILSRWREYLDSFTFSIVHIKGSTNFGPDLLSRNTSIMDDLNDEDHLVELNDFSDLNVIYTNTPSNVKSKKRYNPSENEIFAWMNNMCVDCETRLGAKQSHICTGKDFKTPVKPSLVSQKQDAVLNCIDKNCDMRNIGYDCIDKNCDMHNTRYDVTKAFKLLSMQEAGLGREGTSQRAMKRCSRSEFHDEWRVNEVSREDDERSVREELLLEMGQEEGQISASSPENLALDEDEADTSLLSNLQKKDFELARIRRFCKLGEWPPVSELTKEEARLRELRDKLFLDEKTGLLKFKDRDRETVLVPYSHRHIIMQSLHFGHPSLGRMKTKAKGRYFWPTMSQDLEEFYQTCGDCLQKEQPHDARAVLMSKLSLEPMEVVAIDLIGPLPNTIEGYKYILVTVDLFTKVCKLAPLRNKTAETVAQTFLNYWVCQFGAPLRIYSDQGKEFTNQIWQKMCQEFNISFETRTPYNPRSNPVERYNRIVGNLLRVSNTGESWSSKLPLINLMLLTTVNTATGFTPARLLYGKELNLPYDLICRIDKPLKGVADIIVERSESLKALYEEARKNLCQARVQNENRYSIGRLKKFYLGQKVYVYHPHKIGGKIESSWLGPYVVKEVMTPNIVIVQHPEKPTLKARITVERVRPYYISERQNASDRQWHIPFSVDYEGGTPPFNGAPFSNPPPVEHEKSLDGLRDQESDNTVGKEGECSPAEAEWWDESDMTMWREEDQEQFTEQTEQIPPQDNSRESPSENLEKETGERPLALEERNFRMDRLKERKRLERREALQRERRMPTRLSHLFKPVTARLPPPNAYQLLPENADRSDKLKVTTPMEEPPEIVNKPGVNEVNRRENGL